MPETNNILRYATMSEGKTLSDNSVSSETFTLLHSFVNTKSDGSGCVKNENSLNPAYFVTFTQVATVTWACLHANSKSYKSFRMRPPLPESTLFETYCAPEVRLLWVNLELNQQKSIGQGFDSVKGKCQGSTIKNNHGWLSQLGTMETLKGLI